MLLLNLDIVGHYLRRPTLATTRLPTMESPTYPPQKRTPSNVSSRPDIQAGSDVELAHRYAGQSSGPTDHSDPGDIQVATPKLSTSVERRYLASLFWVMIVCGWNDASRWVTNLDLA